MPRLIKWLLLIAVILLAAFFRLYKIGVLPPGEFYDEAYYGLDALGILDGKAPVFFETNGGREPLFSYIVAACVALFGVGSLAIHVAPAIIGILTIPAVYLAAGELFADDDGLLGEYGSLVAALAMALSFWHQMWSRYGVRAILTPLFAALVVFFLWRGLRTGRWRYFAGCGFVLGLGMYTYQAARLLPVLVLLGFGYATWRSQAWNKKSLYALGTITLVSLLVFAPLGAYALTHADSFMGRVNTVSVLQSQEKFEALGQQLENTLLVFGFRGDASPRVNLPGRPALNLFFFASFVLGIAISLRRIKQPHFFVLLVWLGVMCLPGIMAQQGHTAKRIIGCLPAVTILIAVGLLAPLDWSLRRAETRPSFRFPGTASAAVMSVAIATGFVYSGVRTYVDYFHVWGEDPNLFTHFEAGLAAIGQYAAQRPVDEKIYISPVHVAHPSILYNSQNHPGIKGYHGQYCIVLPDQAEHDTTYIVVPGEESRSIELLDTFLPDAELVATGPLHYEQPYFYAYQAPANAQVKLSPAYPQQANWGNQIQLLGYDLDLDGQASRIAIRLYYRALEEMDTDYTVFVQLVGPHNPKTDSPLWSQLDSQPCRDYRPTSTWGTDEILVDDFELTVPADRVTGETYELIVGFYDWRTLERLPLLDKAGQSVGDYLVLRQYVFQP